MNLEGYKREKSSKIYVYSHGIIELKCYALTLPHNIGSALTFATTIVDMVQIFTEDRHTSLVPPNSSRGEHAETGQRFSSSLVDEKSKAWLCRTHLTGLEDECVGQGARGKLRKRTTPAFPLLK